VIGTITGPIVLFGAGLLLAINVDMARGQCRAEELAKITAKDAGVGDKFGFSISLDGDTAVVGAMENDNSAGAVYVFVGGGSQWEQQAKLVAGDREVGDWFGYSVALQGDTVAIGSRADDDKGGNSGSAYVFVREGEDWSQRAKLLASDGEAGDLFGHSISLDDDTIVVGTIGDGDKGFHAGAVYVFVRSGEQWTQQAKVVPDDGAYRDEFGTSVGLVGDTLIVGSIGDDDNGSKSGSVYVYQRDGETWNFKTKLLADDGEMSDNFGTSVSLDGDTLVIGTPADDDMGPTSGSAYVFVGSGEDWDQVAKLVAGDGEANSQFGESVSLLGDTVVVGAVNDNDGPISCGSAYVFVRNRRAKWKEAAKIIAGDRAECDNAGGSVSLSGDTVIVGAQNDDDAGNNSGSAYIFRGLNDCNDNKTQDICDIAEGTSRDDNHNGIPDECEGNCTGKEKISKAKCQETHGVNKLIVKLKGGAEGDTFLVELTGGKTKEGTLNPKGKGKAKFKKLPSGPGTATATWECGAIAKKDYTCP